MILKINTRRRVTIPESVLDALGIRPGDQLELEERPDGFFLRSRQVDPNRLAPLRDKLERGRGEFKLWSFRDQRHDPSLRN